MSKVVVVPLASKVHDVKSYENIYLQLKSLLKTYNVELLDVVTDIGKLRFYETKIKPNIPLLVFLTGGTSAIARYVIKTLNYKAGIGLAHGYHNSLASALSAKARLEQENLPLAIIGCQVLNLCKDKVEVAIRAIKAVSKLLKAKVGLIADHFEIGEIEAFERKFNMEIVRISYDEVLEHVKLIDDKEIDKTLKTLEEKLRLEHVNLEVLKDILKFYLSLESIVDKHSLIGLAVDCFPYLIKHKVTPCIPLALMSSVEVPVACEGDLRSLTLMLLSKEVTGHSGWIVNPSCIIGDDKLVVAHCTITLSMIDSGRITTHFETKYPYSIAASIPRGTYTLTALSYDLNSIVASKVKVEESGMLDKRRCRTQAVIRLGFNAKKFLDEAISNHHLIIPGDVVEELKLIAKLLRLSFKEYGCFKD